MKKKEKEDKLAKFYERFEAEWKEYGESELTRYLNLLELCTDGELQKSTEITARAAFAAGFSAVLLNKVPKD